MGLKRARIGNRITALLVSVILVISSIIWPQVTSLAASELELSVDSSWQSVTAKTDEWSDFGKAELRFTPGTDVASMKAIADKGYKTLVITYEVTTFTAADGQNAGVMPFASYGSAWSNNDVWESLSSEGEYTTSLDLSAINTTSTENVTFGIQIANLKENSTVRFRITKAVLSGDGGSSGGSGDQPGTGDNTEDMNKDIEYNYAKLLQESLYLYDANMCGSDVEEKSEFSWRADCHTEDAQASYNGRTVDVSGGYHDAGDHGKFMLPQAYSAVTLGMAHMEFSKAFADTGTEAHFKRIMDRFTDYFERCTVLGSDGTVQAVCYQVGNGTTDHNYWGAPENQPSRSGEVWFTDDTNTCTDIVCLMSAALAAQYINYEDKTALSYAEKLFTYADTHTKATSVTTPSDLYNSDSWDDDYALAAALLYKATGNSAYKTKYVSVYGNKYNPNWVLSWNNVASAALLYSPDGMGLTAFTENQTGLVSGNTKSDDNNFFFLQKWGSARYNAAHQMTGLMYDHMFSKNNYSAWANGQMKYILGNNPGSKCFVVGYNQLSSKYPHHRAASGYTGSVQGTKAQAHVLVGALLGGPTDKSTNYIDTADDYTANEVALDYNAGLVGAAAGLYLYINNCGTDEEKSQQKVVALSDISSELRKVDGGTEVDPTPEPEPEPKPGALACETKALSWPVLSYGYSSADTKNIQIGNSGELALTGVEARFKNGSAFELDGSVLSELAAGENATIKVKLKSGLNAGSYSDTLNITSANGSASVTLTATIDKADMPGSIVTNTPAVSANSVTVTAVVSGVASVAEYAISKVKTTDPAALSWKESGSFTGLSEFTTYYVYSRVKESDNYKAGQIAACIQVTTLVADPYRIDLSKVSDPAYVKALSLGGGAQTIAVSENDGVYIVTFADNKEYTVTGEGDNVAVYTGSATKLTLDNATVKSVNVTPQTAADYIIDMKGSNSVSEKIQCTPGSSAPASLVITGDNTALLSVFATDKPAISVQGSLTLEGGRLSIKSGNQGIAATGTVTICGASVDIESSKEAVKAHIIEVTEGVLAATSKELVPGESVVSADSSIKLTGGSVSAEGGTDNGSNSFGVKDENGSIVVDGADIEGNPTFSKDPVDESGESIVLPTDINTDSTFTFKETGTESYAVTVTGALMTPEIEVVVCGKTLVSGTDYTVTYKNNRNAGTATATVTGIGSYKGSHELTFTILKRSITKAKITMATKALYTGKAVKPTVTATYGASKLVLGRNYKVTYSYNVNFGKAKAVISGIGNYGGTVTKYFYIVTKAGKLYNSGNFKYKITKATTDGTGTVTLYSVVKKTATVTVPSAIRLGGKYFKVTAIGAKSFKGNTTITSLAIGKNVTAIGDYGFYGCTSLKSVKFTGNLKSIGRYAFCKCARLAGISLPASTYKIGAYAFYGCKSLKTMIVRSTRMTSKTIGAKVFTGTYKTIKVRVPSAKYTAYKKLFIAKGMSTKAVFVR